MNPFRALFSVSVLTGVALATQTARRRNGQHRGDRDGQARREEGGTPRTAPQETATPAPEQGAATARLEQDTLEQERQQERRGGRQVGRGNVPEEEQGGERETGDGAATQGGGIGETEDRSRQEEGSAERRTPGAGTQEHAERRTEEQATPVQERNRAEVEPQERGPSQEGSEERGAERGPDGQPAAAGARAPTDDLGPRRPGVEHEPLRALLGTWEAEVQFGPSTERGSMRSTLLDGLWLLADFEGQLMESPYYGHNMLGWDSDRRKYVGCWVDSRSTSLAFSEGTWDERSRTMTMESLAPDSMTGQKLVNVTRLQDEDHHVFSMHPGSPEAPPVMTITYTRRK